jgi:hypothetical protein
LIFNELKDFGKQAATLLGPRRSLAWTQMDTNSPKTKGADNPEIANP